MSQVPQRDRASSGGEEQPLLGSTSLQGNNRSIINAGTKETTDTQSNQGVGLVTSYYAIVHLYLVLTYIIQLVLQI